VAHLEHETALRPFGKLVIDLTPAAIGPYVVPSVNLHRATAASNINMVTCGGQATIPIVAAISAVAPVLYAEIVASVSSRSAGPGTRANIDEFTETTARAIVDVGGAKHGKAIIILNPAEPPMIMRDTIYCLAQGDDRHAICDSIERMVERVQTYVPGYRLKQQVQFEQIGDNAPLTIPGIGTDLTGLKVSVYLEVEGAGHYLPVYAGNLDIMTSAAIKTAEAVLAHRQRNTVR
jgi:acetaldehyde dehydrogenase